MENVGTRHVKQNALGTGVPALDRLLDESLMQTKAAALTLMAVAVLDEGLGSRILRRLERDLEAVWEEPTSEGDEADPIMAKRWASFAAGLNLRCCRV